VDEDSICGLFEFRVIDAAGGNCNFMWRLALGTILSLLPWRWRDQLRPGETFPWERSTILSGIVEGLLALGLLVDWYSHSVTTWAADALDSALHNGPASSIPGPLIGLAGLALWSLHPLTWLIGYFVIEGAVRLLAAAFSEETLGTLPLALCDWCYGKITHRPPERDALHTPDGGAQLRSLLSAVREKIVAARFPEMEDEMVEVNEGDEVVIEIHSSRPKPEWIPPKTVRIGDSYFRLVDATRGKSPRPFVFRLEGLPAGVPGRTVIVYEGVRRVQVEESERR
jgi:hypothetical protein